MCGLGSQENGKMIGRLVEFRTPAAETVDAASIHKLKECVAAAKFSGIVEHPASVRRECAPCIGREFEFPRAQSVEVGEIVGRLRKKPPPEQFPI
jgi:hypothetical protein